MPRNRDLFDDTTMTFGEHLEVLRVHVWRALIGLILGVIVSLFFGDTVIKILKSPIDEALRRHNKPNVEDDLGGMDFGSFIDFLFSDEEEEDQPEEPPVVEPQLKNDELEVEVSLTELRDLIEKVAPGSLKTPPPVKPKPVPQDGSSEETTTDDANNSGDSAAADDSTKSDDTAPTADAEAEAETEDEDLVRFTIRSDEIALFKETAERFNQPVTYKVEEAFMTYIKVSLVSGLVLTSPWVCFQIWQFVAAGLYPHERKHVYIYLPMSIGLFISGAVFCFYFVFPIVLDFLISFNDWLGIEIQPRLSEYISLVLMLPVMFGVSFQLPLIMLFLERIGIMTIDGYKANWRMAVLIIAIASMLLTPSDPTSMLLMMIPLVFLYFGGILLCQIRPGADADPLA